MWESIRRGGGKRQSYLVKSTREERVAARRPGQQQPPGASLALRIRPCRLGATKFANGDQDCICKEELIAKIGPPRAGPPVPEVSSTTPSLHLGIFSCNFTSFLTLSTTCYLQNRAETVFLSDFSSRFYFRSRPKTLYQVCFLQ